MTGDLISREALKETFEKVLNRTDGLLYSLTIFHIIDNALTVKPCENCDLYFKAMTKEEQKGGSTYEQS